MLERIEREEDRGRTLDAKLTALLSGVVAFIGFSFRANVNAWSAGAALLYIVPLAFLFNAFLTKRGKRAPTAGALRLYFPTYPVSTLKESIDAMLFANETNETINTRKAGAIDYAIVLTGLVTVILLITQFVVAAGVADVRKL